MKDNFSRDTKMAKENTPGQIKRHFTRVNGSVISFKEEVSSILLIIANIMEISNKICCMEMECIFGLMVPNIQVSFVIIKNMVEEFMNGLMEGNLKAYGVVDLGKEKAHIYCRTDTQKEVYGGQIKE